MSDLGSRLAAVLPKGHKFGIYHLSTPPTKCSALYSAPPNERPDRTFCENHFLAVTIDSEQNGETAASDARSIVFAIEIMIYTTAHTSTLFVAKADSTGYLSLLNLPKGTASPIRQVCSEFVSYLADCRRRKDLPFVVSLFARSQSQYLFPGSIENSNKHVLDDRGLIKWWCRVLDPMLATTSWQSSQGYLVTPGLEQYETRGFIPRDSLPKWSLTHPLHRISHYTREFDWVPPRCLIPRYPDDPKSRFRDELDEEAAGSGAMKVSGAWKSVKTLDMFWEMMAFRQECSSGRMTGFIWLVFENDSQRPSTPQDQQTSTVAPQTTPRKIKPSKHDTPTITDAQRKLDEKKKKEKEKEKRRKRHAPGAKITIRGPRSKTEQKNHLPKQPESTPYYHWPVAGRGDKLVSEKIYKRIMELLLHLDFATLEKACSSTKRWINEASMGSTWGVQVSGELEATAVLTQSNDAPQVNNLSGLVKRKREDGGDGVKTLDAGLVKKVKADGPNELEASLVRKKPKH